MLEGDDDAVSLLQEKEIDNLAGKTETQKGTHTHSMDDFTHSCKLYMTFVFSTFPPATFYLQRQVGPLNTYLQLH